jgi:hypothetical protein
MGRAFVVPPVPAAEGCCRRGGQFRVPIKPMASRDYAVEKLQKPSTKRPEKRQISSAKLADCRHQTLMVFKREDDACH